LENDFAQFQQDENKLWLNKARAKVIRLVTLYQSKFLEYFKGYQDKFFQVVWGLVAQNRISVGKESERLVFSLLRYLGDCSSISNYQDFMRQNLQAIFTALILPNIALTQQDVDEYEDEPDVYIKNDLEESDSETRRRQCMKFVQQLSKRF
jgi:exportin-2 (importin alpha re-exporter)